MMKKINILLFVIFLGMVNLQAQQKEKEKKYAIRTIAFYNVENLFDTINDPKTFDDDRTPEGTDRWTSKVYNDHVQKIAKAIADIGRDVTKQPPDIVGLCEVENESVIVDLINTSHLRNHNYGIVHYDSPDSRGIDVALIYKKNVFTPIESRNYPLEIADEKGWRRNTRDQLVVQGLLDGEKIYLIVNHWPSRSGGEAASRPKREAAASLNKSLIDDILAKDPNAKIFSMGDFNDDPTNSSFKKILKTIGQKAQVKSNSDLFNPMEEMLKKGIGSLAYQDSWHLFDQIFFTGGLLNENKSTYRFWKAGVFNKSYLATPSGAYKGYPFRSMVNGNYTWGYSDHFPVYLFLIREVKTAK